MDKKIYNKLLKYVYFEGYADSYEEAEQLIEEVDDHEFEALYEEFILTEATETIVDYLISEGFVDDVDAAHSILNVMSEEWLQQILEVKITPMDPKHFKSVEGKLTSNPNRNLSRGDRAALKRIIARRSENEPTTTNNERVTLGSPKKPKTQKPRVVHQVDYR